MTLPNDGERMIPAASEPYVFWEHVYRYRFAAQYSAGRDVVDIACGEGYGSAALTAAGARRVIGIDIDQVAVTHARSRYGIDARLGPAEAIPLPNESVDMVVSFETIEHLPDPSLLVRECHRVLRQQGKLIISTPNREVYSSEARHNRFHLVEMNEAEFADVLDPWFAATGWWGQCRTAGSWWPGPLAFTEQSPWMATRVGRGVRRVLQRFASPRYQYQPRQANRDDPVQAVLAPERPIARLVVPFVVSPRVLGEADRPRYLIAVALKKPLARI
jgi:SAM-dependent methyltransferase